MKLLSLHTNWEIMEKYEILFPRHAGAFMERVNELYLTLGNYLDTEKAQGRTLRYSKVFLSDISNQYKHFAESLLYQECLLGTPCSIVGQPPLGGYKVAILVKTSDEEETLLFHSLRLTEKEAKGLDSAQQTELLFRRYMRLTREEDLSMRTHLVRTWIYVNDIDTNYAGVVKARNEVFSRYGLTPNTHFIASTGIGGQTRDRGVKVAMDFLTFPNIHERDKTYLQALDNLNPTHEYGVAFERGTRVDNGHKYTYYISGTASIDNKGKVLYPHDVVKQTGRLLENIGALLKDGGATMRDIKYFIIYLRDISDNDIVNMLMEKAYPGIPRIIVLASVCRPQWLVEMECVAIKEK